MNNKPFLAIFYICLLLFFTFIPFNSAVQIRLSEQFLRGNRNPLIPNDNILRKVAEAKYNQILKDPIFKKINKYLRILFDESIYYAYDKVIIQKLIIANLQNMKNVSSGFISGIQEILLKNPENPKDVNRANSILRELSTNSIIESELKETKKLFRKVAWNKIKIGSDFIFKKYPIGPVFTTVVLTSFWWFLVVLHYKCSRVNTSTTNLRSRIETHLISIAFQSGLGILLALVLYQITENSKVNDPNFNQNFQEFPFFLLSGLPGLIIGIVDVIKYFNHNHTSNGTIFNNSRVQEIPNEPHNDEFIDIEL